MKKVISLLTLITFIYTSQQALAQDQASIKNDLISSMSEPNVMTIYKKKNDTGILTKSHQYYELETDKNTNNPKSVMVESEANFETTTKPYQIKDSNTIAYSNLSEDFRTKIESISNESSIFLNNPKLDLNNFTVVQFDMVSGSNLQYEYFFVDNNNPQCVHVFRTRKDNDNVFFLGATKKCSDTNMMGETSSN